MAMAIDDVFELDFSGYSSTTTITTTTVTTTTTSTENDHHTCDWNVCSPIVDWEAFPVNHDDFQDLIESMMEDEGLNQTTSNSNSSTDTILIDEETSGEDFKGLRLVHLLMAVAEALTGVNKSRDLARVILVRLKELVSLTTEPTWRGRMAHQPPTSGSQHCQEVATAEDQSERSRTGRRLVAFAASIGQPFSFHQCRLDSDGSFRPSALKLVKGEALVMNCMLHLPHFNYRAPDSIASFLCGAKTLNPRLVTLVEEEVGPIGDGGFVGRFMDSLHHYSALYDSLEAGFPMQSKARALVERVFLGPRIAGSLARIYSTRADEEGCCWGIGWVRAGLSQLR
ncbi:hypothetical protein GH714_023825 [Hevea brasiliensis]|uniref:Uncharacterized protein n=1 Tax=Hevea brasiliensis TaxID=3981 RepID=A0A6A6KTB4_HEVBR|nr:hypothetical protein GH714_023825 [Hevea brasiliensis]